jgi:hypothetical protein
MPHRVRREEEEIAPEAEAATQTQPAEPVSLEALGARGNEVARVAALQQAQRGHGNAAVSKLLRKENPELEDKVPAPVPLVKHTTGEQVDAFLDSSPFFKTLVEEKVKGGTKAAGHVHIHDPAGFKKVAVDYYMSRLNGATGTTFTKEEAEEREPDTNAFRDGSEIHLHQDRGEPGTAVHESMHLFSNTEYRDQLGLNVNEGTTEYFAKKLCAEQKIKRGDFYPDQYRSVKKLVGAVGEDTVTNAFFKGDIDALRTAVDATGGGFFNKVRELFGGSKKGGDGAFDKWVGFMKAGDYSSADKLL